MCGIAGWLGNLPDAEDYGMRTLKALQHRALTQREAGRGLKQPLVHTRLNIIDLSATGAQPMGNEDGTVWTVFNGEIYNHREPRHDLEARGHVFRGHTDTGSRLLRLIS